MEGTRVDLIRPGQLPARVVGILARSEIWLWSQVDQMTDQEIIDLRGMGETGLTTIRSGPGEYHYSQSFQREWRGFLTRNPHYKSLL